MCVKVLCVSTSFSQWEVVPGVVDAEHRVVVGGHASLWRRALVQRAVLGFAIEQAHAVLKMPPISQNHGTGGQTLITLQTCD